MSRHPVFIEDRNTPTGHNEKLANDRRPVEPNPATDANPDASVSTSPRRQDIAGDDAVAFGAPDPSLK